MLIGHFSDLHGDLRALLHAPQQPDVWVDSGDFFPDDPTYGYGSPNEQVNHYQRKWFNGVREEFLERLGGKPLLTLQGNHDDVSLYGLLRHRKYPVFEVTPEGVDVAGVRWAGFGYTPLQLGPELLLRLLHASLAAQPQVLVTHAPPHDVLCGGKPDWGLPCLSATLRSDGHRVKLHLFGHVHEDGGRMQETAWGVRHYNGARKMRFIEL